MPSNIIMLATGIKGNCKVEEYKDGMYLDSYAFSVGKHINADRAIYGGNDGFTAWSDVTISKPEDQSDFLLLKAAALGTHIDDVKIVVLSEEGGSTDKKPHEDKVIQMTEVILQETSVDGYANSLSSRSYTLSWSKLRMEFKFREEDGTTGTPASGDFGQDRVEHNHAVTEGDFKDP